MKLLSRYVTFRVVAKIAADAGGKAAMLVITIVAARQLNPDPFAILALAMATGWLLGVATDAGLSMHLARETARGGVIGGVSDAQRGRQFVLEIVSLRAGLAFLAATITVLATPYIVPRHWRMQFVLVVLVQLCGAVIETVAHYFRGLQRSEIESAIHIAHRLTTLALALAVLWWWRRLDYLAIAMLMPAAIAMLVSIGIALSLSGSREPVSPGTGLSPREFLIHVFPLGAAALLSALYFRIDVYFIQQWHGFQPVGGYNAAFRLVEALRLLPAAVMAVTFPLLVQTRDIELIRKIGGALGAAGLALAVICAAGAPIIIPFIYGDFYAFASPAFAVLALALPLFFLNYALTHQVIGWDGQRAYLAIVTLALAANIGANLLLVPSRGIVGAAIATVLTELIVTAGCLYTLARHEMVIGRLAGDSPS
ncbi:MAG TPA: oligosaccharide flippase family protein [Vicinamibacterales bacterium]|nr:oligosaccharide flippase family protein [Vicinamibacterales bacterium]